MNKLLIICAAVYVLSGCGVATHLPEIEKSFLEEEEIPVRTVETEGDVLSLVANLVGVIKILNCKIRGNRFWHEQVLQAIESGSDEIQTLTCD